MFGWLFSSSKSEIVDDTGDRKFVPLKADPYAGFTKDDWSSAGLDIVYSMGLSTDDSFWNGSVAHCDSVLARIAKLRLQYTDQQPPQLRRAIMDWFDHYESKARENRSDCETQAHRKRHEAYCERSDAKRDRERKLADVLRQQGHL
jgi:hypothetical protein